MAEFGELLRRARDYRGLSLRDVERATKISRIYLSALETENWSELPPPTYARGIVRNYAQHLGLDPDDVLARYDELQGGPPGVSPLRRDRTALPQTSHLGTNFAVIGGMIVISMVVFTWMYSAFFRTENVAETPTVGIATVTPAATSILLLTPLGTAPAAADAGQATQPTQPVEPTATSTVEAVFIAPEPTATEVVIEQPSDDVPPTEAVPADEPVEEPTPGDGTSTQVGEGASTFVLMAADDVWVQVVGNGVTLFDGTLTANSELIVYADDVAITSGNADLVQLWVNGENVGGLGASWDATYIYP